MATAIPSGPKLAVADVSYNRFSNVFYAGVVVLRMEDLAVVEKQGVVAEVAFPYVPGLLSFRETPVLLKVVAKIQLTKEDPEPHGRDISNGVLWYCDAASSWICRLA